MITCPSCGTENGTNARYCSSCGRDLQAAPPPQSEEQNASTQPTQPLGRPAAASAEPVPLDEPLPVGMELGSEYTIQTLLADTDGMRSYRGGLREPWRRCAYCGSASQPGEAFCDHCGAQLSNQTVLIQETVASQPSGAALIERLPVQALPDTALPQLIEVRSIDERRFAIMPEGGPAALTPLSSFFGEEGLQLDEADTLQIGLRLARTLELLHSHELALGRLRMADLGLTPDRIVRLADASALRVSQGPDDQADDLIQLAEVLERLAGIERRTTRLDEQQETSALMAGLGDVLRAARTKQIASAGAFAEALQGVLTVSSTPTTLRSRTGYQTHTGMVRDHNEDSLFAWDLRMIHDNLLANGGLYIVADGMGGHEGGEVASALAISTVARILTPLMLDPAMQQGPLDTAMLATQIRSAVQQANNAIAEEGARRGSDMGTTITMGLVIGDRAIIGNVGDSRTYLYREGVLRRVTRDHSLVMRLVEAGQITEDEIYTHPHRSAILRSLGEAGTLDTDIFEERLQPGDRLLVCSDGLWDMVRDPEIQRIVGQDLGLNEIAAQLVDAANAAGGEDNVTIVLVEFTAANLGSSSSSKK